MAAHVYSEMEANVWRILVAEGDAVKEGDQLMILESMKMEIPVISEDEGLVQEIHVEEGETITSGQLLADLG